MARFARHRMVVLLAGLSLSCGDVLKEDEDEDETTVACQSSADGSSRQVEATSTATGFDINVFIYSDGSCTDKIITLREVNGFTSTGTGSYTASLQDTLNLTIHSASVAASYNAAAICGKSDWTVDVAVSVKAADCPTSLTGTVGTPPTL